MTPNEKHRGLIKNIISLGGVQIANYLLPLISVPIISRIIGPDKFGIINYSAAYISYFTLSIAFGFDLTATRKISKDPTNISLRRRVFSEVFKAQILLFIISTIIFCFSLYTIPILKNEKYVAIFSFLLCISTVLTQNWLFQAMQELYKVALLNVIAKILFTAAILISLKSKEDYYLQPLLIGLTQILISCISFIWAFKKYNLKFMNVTFHEIINLLKLEKTVFFSMVVISFYTITNTIVLGILKTEQDVGYFSAAQRLIIVSSSIINVPLAQSFYPFIGNAFGKNKESGILVVQKLLPIIVLLTLLIAILMFIFGPFALHLFYGRAFEPAVHAFLVMSFVPMIIALSNVFGIQIMLNLKMDKIFFKITAGGAILGLVLNYVMINKWGFVGTAWNWLIVEIYITISMYIALRIRGINAFDFRQFKYSSILETLKPLQINFFKKNKSVK